MKKPPPGKTSPFSSSTHQEATPKKRDKTPAPAGRNVPASVREIMAQNAVQSAARQSKGGGLPVVASSYKPSGKVGPYAFMPMLLVTLVGALLTSAIYFFVSPHFNYLLVTQIYLGGLIGGAVWLGAKAAKARSSCYVRAFAVVATLLVFGIYHTAMVWQGREDSLDYYAPLMAKKSGQSVSVTRAKMAQQLSMARAAQYYWQDNYDEGVTLTDDNNVGSSGTHLAGLAYVGLLLFEFGFTALIAAAVAATATTARFSESQGRWYCKKRAFAVKSPDLWEILRALQAEDFARARQIALNRTFRANAVGAVYFSRVAGEAGGWIEMTVTQDKRQHLLYEAQVSDDKLRALGVTV